MTSLESLNYFITQEMILRAEQSDDWIEIRLKGERVIAAGGKVVIGVTDFVKLPDFSNWLAMAEEEKK